MILALLRVGWLNLKRDSLALALTFAVPIALFSVFAAVFGSMDAGAQRKVKIAVLRQGGHPPARDLLARLEALDALDIVELEPGAPADDAEERVRLGQVSLAVVVPPDFGDPDAEGPETPVRLLADTSNPVGLEVVQGAVRAALLPQRAPDRAPDADAATEAGAIEVVDVLGGDGRKPSISFFAAGIGVMFLLFAVSGRSGILIEERENGVLTRMLTSRLGVGRLLFGRWLYLLLLGVAQVTAMFVWGAVVFGLDLFTPRHLAGFSIMTITTAAAAAAFALLLAVACKTRAQLSGVAVVLVLVMSALGGSMFPRFLMPDGLRAAGRFTFNAWAIDGYRKVFWYEAAPGQLAPELAVLGATTLVFFAGALLLARRWRRT